MTAVPYRFPCDTRLVQLNTAGGEVREDAEQLLSCLGSVVIVAPHPDDETLGCGGLIAACAQLNIAVTIVAVTNGECSHPQSKTWTQQRLAQVRCEEQRLALQTLGLASPPVIRLNLPDGQVALQSADVLSYARVELYALVRQYERASVFVTSPSDDHPDHRACAALVATVAAHVHGLQVFHYSVWPTATEDNSKHAPPGDNRWQLDIRPALHRKASAIACHRSQRGLVVSDDPQGFCMPESLLRRALASHETYQRSC